MDETGPLHLLHVDDHLLVVDKPAGLLAHASKMAADVDVDLLDQLRQQVQGEVYLVHRLDRATSGLVLFNGAVVAFIAIACFGALVQIVKEGVLW